MCFGLSCSRRAYRSPRRRSKSITTEKNREDEQSDVIGPTKGQKLPAVWSAAIRHVTAPQLFHRLALVLPGVGLQSPAVFPERARPLHSCAAGIVMVRG